MGGLLAPAPKTPWQIKLSGKTTCKHQTASSLAMRHRTHCGLAALSPGPGLDSFVGELVDRSRRCNLDHRSRRCNLDHFGCACLFPRVGHASATRHRGQVVAKGKPAGGGVWAVRHGSRPYGSAKSSGLLEVASVRACWTEERRRRHGYPTSGVCVQPERPHRTSLGCQQPAPLPAILQGHPCGNQHGILASYHANGPLYPVRLSGTRHPRVFAVLTKLFRPHRLNLWSPRAKILTARSPLLT